MIRKIILAVIVFCVVSVVGLQLFLAYGLTDSMRKWIIPSAKTRYGADVSVGRVSVNLLGGSLGIHNIKVTNPPGFMEPLLLAATECRLKVGLPALLASRTADIKHAALKNVVLAVVRNREGDLNLKPMLNAMQTQTTTAPSSLPSEEKDGSPRAAMPNIVIKKMEMTSRLDYLDWQVGQPFKLSLELKILLNNIANFGFDDLLSGTVKVQGNILEAGHKCAFDLNGRIAPLSDPLHASFDMAGSMQTIDLKTFKGLIEKIGLTAPLPSSAATANSIRKSPCCASN